MGVHDARVFAPAITMVVEGAPQVLCGAVSSSLIEGARMTVPNSGGGNSCRTPVADNGATTLRCRLTRDGSRDRKAQDHIAVAFAHLQLQSGQVPAHTRPASILGDNISLFNGLQWSETDMANAVDNLEVTSPNVEVVTLGLRMKRCRHCRRHSHFTGLFTARS